MTYGTPAAAEVTEEARPQAASGRRTLIIGLAAAFCGLGYAASFHGSDWMQASVKEGEQVMVNGKMVTVHKHVAHTSVKHDYDHSLDAFHEMSMGEDFSQAKCLTVWGHHDGFGASYGAVLSGVIFSVLQHKEFRHTQTKTLAHWDVAKDGTYELLDRFLGLKADPTAVECVDKHHFIINPCNLIETCPVPTRKKIMPVLRDMYFGTDKTEFDPTDFGLNFQGTGPSAPRPTPQCSKESCDVVIHIRRGDDSALPFRMSTPQYISDSKWLTVMDTIYNEIVGHVGIEARPDDSHVVPWKQNQYPYQQGGDTVEDMKQKPIRFHVYSEGEVANFAAYTEWSAQHPGTGMRFTLNGDLRQAFHAMVVADVLAYGPSSFPGLAAWYNLGKHYKVLTTRGALDANGKPTVAASLKAFTADQ